MQKINLVKILFFSFLVFGHSFKMPAAEKITIPEGRLTSPYEACKEVIIVSKQKYEDNKSQWSRVEKDCKLKIQIVADVGIKAIDPLKEGVEYLEFSQRVAAKVVENLIKSKKFAECSASCFSGATSCPATLNEDGKPVQCAERKKEVVRGLQINSRKIRLELALSDDAPGALNVNVRNALSVGKEKFINTNLRDFEMGTPNPVGRTELSKREMQAAQRKVEYDRNKLEEEFKQQGHDKKIYHDWMSIKLLENFEEHRARYRALIYEEAPIFAVIDTPAKYEADEPAWSEAQIASAFKKLAENAKSTQDKVNWSLNNSKLEFSRVNGEALGQWMASLAPGVQDRNDLLFYIGMKNQVEEVLKMDPSACGVATAMESRLHSKEMQNNGVTLASALVGGVVIKGVSSAVGNMFRIGRALSGAEAAGLTGLALGAASLGESFRKYNSTATEAATLSGVGGIAEGSALRKGEDMGNVREGVKMSLVFAPIDVVGGWAVGKTLYSALANQMAKDLPGLGKLIKSAKVNTSSRDQLVDKWLASKVKSALHLSDAEKAALESKEAGKIIESLTEEIQIINPDFFKNPKNMDFLLKTAATTIKKETGDPANLGELAKNLLLNFNTEAMNGSWNLQAQGGLLKVFNNAIEELRTVARTDPATYAKFTSDPQAREKIMLIALKKSGAKDEEVKSMYQCAIPR